MKFYTWIFMVITIKMISAKKKPQDSSNMTGNIVNGVPITISMYPFLAEITFMDQHLCGGVIITSRIILTAGHCTEKPYPDYKFMVLLGSSNNLQGTVYPVIRTLTNREYEHAEHQYMYDLGMMFVNRRIKFGPTVQIAKLVNHDRWRDKRYNFVIAGYGWESPYGATSSNLKMVRMHYVDPDVCNNTVTDEPMPVTERNFCLIGKGWSSDCFGDSGSGVIWKGSYVVGLVTTGRSAGCGSDVLPSMYIDLNFYGTWIQKNVKKLHSVAKHLRSTNSTTSD